MIHIGLDLHTKNSYVRAMREDGSLLAGRRVYHSDIAELWQYLGQFGSEAKRVVFEATGNSRWMYRLLRQDATIEAVAVTPHKVRIIADTVAKTDKIDATVLATLSRINMLPRSYLPDEELEELRELTRHRAGLVRVRTLAKNKVTGALVRSGVLRPYNDVFGVLGRKWLSEITLPVTARLQVDHWLNIIDVFEKRIDDVERKLYREVGRKERWSGDIAILDSLPGWGTLTAITVLSELGEYRRFKSRSAVSCFAGLVPSSKRSDKSCRYGKISREGPRALRSILIEVSLHGVRAVPRYKTLYDRVSRAKGSNVAKTAVARQMLEDGWTMLMKQEPFRFDAVEAVSLTRAG
ncbi:MAG: IS110 family transposase [Chlorobium sp.]